MFIVIIVLSLFIAGVGLWGFVFPSNFMNQAVHFTRTSKGLYLIVGWRLLFGLMLVISAPFSSYSTFFYIIGSLSLFGGLVTIMVGPRYIEQYLGWWQMRPAVYLRIIMLVSWLIGVTLAFMAFKSV